MWNASIIQNGKEQVYSFEATDRDDAADAARQIAMEEGGTVRMVFEDVRLVNSRFQPQ